MDFLFSFILPFFGLILAVTIHEFAHALVADRLGDPTPRAAGRLTLNPLSHLDPLGTIMIFIAHFGWGKPVPIDPYNFSSPRRDEILVALAGPASNIFLGVVLGIFYQITGIYHPIIQIIAVTDFYLAFFNLLPLPPLDGSKIFLNLLPIETALKWQEAFDRYGYFLIIILLFLPFAGSSLISFLVSPPVNLLTHLFF
ncbi:site-2 protease family protein [Candidatus Shapirobacteria bacterium CG06_land_8_20_14_3_00_40_12]|uniref:Site-2 protease family protein n=2 Tax=Candidatus Shapironibacteriota TaxID=1752721 RepID=A0A2M7TSI7_9BACT|nr:MAG: site-2 protease family protein [Candidatus Shapirobacteria bacterium CG06_land_8_20_14_3_00_40_12]PIZ58682.1 MAG: site-2 protease family protein [Candidatus Shapirobacteria bacterium CG_4_10_14_0_2_um_filter_40_12]